MNDELEYYRKIDAGLTSYPLDRREFIKLFGGGIVIFFSAGFPLSAQRREYPEDVNAYLHILENGQVNCFTGKIEMGQGINTALAQICAEQLEVSFKDVHMIMGDTQRCPWDMGTFGSRTIRYFGPSLREASAKAREILLDLAAKKLNLPVEKLAAHSGRVQERNNPSRYVTYAQLTQGRQITHKLDKKPDIQTHSEFTVSGLSKERTDADAKVSGKALFAGDIRVPDMRYAALVRPPAHGSVLKSLDTAEAEKIPGVQVIRDGDLVAALHTKPDTAALAASRIHAEYDNPSEELTEENIFDHLRKSAPEKGETVFEQGNVDEGRTLSSRTFKEIYLNHYVAHAPMEPHTALVQIENDQITVWASTQRPFGVQPEVARTLDAEESQVRVITPFVGGGFGGKNANLQAAQAARLAKKSGYPVQVAWTREDEFFFDTFRPAAFVKIESGMNDAHRMVHWDFKTYFAGSRSSEPVYAFPHSKVISYGSWGYGGSADVHPFDTGAWRGPGSNTNVFARESHVDIMAAAAAQDPLEFRFNNLDDARMKRVLQAAADKFNWKPAPAPSGRGFGIACVDYLDTYVAIMAEVEVDRKFGDIQVKRIVCAQDMGQIINPEGGRLQMESCVIMGLGYALKEKIEFKGGRILTRNFDTYEIPRFSWLPKIETVLVENPGYPARGGGEPAVTPMGAVIANAVFDACGARMKELPMTPDMIKKALTS